MKLFTASLLFSCLPLAMNSFSATINLSTGLDSTNTLITSGNVPDAHWTVVGAGPARTVFPDNIDFVSFFEPWVPNGPNSDWIALNPLSLSGNARTYQVTFSLAGLDASTATLSGGLWTVDDTGFLVLNGNVLGILGGFFETPWETMHTFTSPSPSMFNAGLNTLQIIIGANDNFHEGVRFEGTVTAASAVPEPGTGLMLLGAGVAAVIGRRLTSRISRRNASLVQ